MANRLKKAETVAEIVFWRLCLGCGACVPACPQHAVRMMDVRTEGLRPVVDSTKCARCHRCVDVCPGRSLSGGPIGDKTLPELRRSWGPVLEIWEGYAVDKAIRYKGSSGGVVTALSCFCLSELGMSGVLHVAAKSDNPLVNVPVFSTSKEDLLCRTGSRYSPAAPCAELGLVEAAGSQCVFIGKPCDVAGLRNLQVLNEDLGNKFGLVISLFCAGTPATKGTEEVLQRLGAKPAGVVELKYRGEGWPGNFRVGLRGANDRWREMNYEECWGGILSRHIPFRCELCPDSTGEWADISCGDAWHRPAGAGQPGWSLVLVRTERGKDILHKAMGTGYVKMSGADLNALVASQKSLLNRRRLIWGKLLAMGLAGAPRPNLRGFSLLANWWGLCLLKKIRSFGGMLWRVARKRLTQPMRVFGGTGADNLLYSGGDATTGTVEGKRCRV